jgi:hypothetical protein
MMWHVASRIETRVLEQNEKKLEHVFCVASCLINTILRIDVAGCLSEEKIRSVRHPASPKISEAPCLSEDQ